MIVDNPNFCYQYEKGDFCIHGEECVWNKLRKFSLLSSTQDQIRSGTYDSYVFSYISRYLGKDVTKIVLSYWNEDIYYFFDKIFLGYGNKRKAFSVFLPGEDGTGFYINLVYSRTDKCYSMEVIIKKGETRIIDTGIMYRELGSNLLSYEPLEPVLYYLSNIYDGKKALN